MPEGISAFTEGVIGGTEPVYVRFTEVPEGNADDLIRFTPAVEGTAVLDGTALTFTPDPTWRTDTEYTGYVRLPGGREFSFSFLTKPRRAEMTSGGLVIPGEGKPPYVTGRVVTSDYSTVGEIEKWLRAEQGGEPLTLTVKQEENAKIYTFRVSGFNRAVGADPVLIRSDASGTNFEQPKGRITVNVAAENTFRATDVTVVDRVDPRLTVAFSEALDPRQDLTGLVRLSDSTTVTTRIDGNRLDVFPAAGNLGTVALVLDGGIRNAAGTMLGKTIKRSVDLGRVKPALRKVTGNGIMPHEGERLFVFEAIGLNTVYLELTEVFGNNVMDWLQIHNLADGIQEWNIYQSGRLVARELIPLSRLSDAVNAGRWTRYAIKLDDYVDRVQGSIFKVRLGFSMEHAAADCEQTLADFGLKELTTEDPLTFDPGFRMLRSKLGGYHGVAGNYEGFDSNHRSDPCKPAYYNHDRFLSQTILSSNLGLIAKRNPDRSTLVFATHLSEAAPAAGVTVRAYDEQRQEIHVGRSDAAGRVVMTTATEPAYFVAEDKNGDAAYLDLRSNTDQDRSRFATGGARAPGGVQGTFYAERGVWRPGDSVFLNFVLYDEQQRVPPGLPVKFTLTDARNRVVETRNVRPLPGTTHYSLKFKTNPNDETGTWRATVKAGDRTFRRGLMIETVKPNRLSIDLTPPAGGLSAANNQLAIEGKWLYGAPASNLRADVALRYTPREPDFPDWRGYRFVNPEVGLNDEEQEAFDGELNAEGQATFALPLSADAGYPGPLYANLSTKLYEPGGNFSIDNQRVPVDPYEVYAGVVVPRDDWGSARLPVNEIGTLRVAAVDKSGNAVSGRKLSVQLLRVNWRYWWQDNNNNRGRYTATETRETVGTYAATTSSDGGAAVRVKLPRWGRYLVRVCDEGGHCGGQFFYAGYNRDNTDRESASLIRPVAEREEVSVGERVSIKLPTSAGGKMLVSLETGAGSIEQYWVDTEAGQTSFSFVADERMVPTVYANVTVLQDYAQTTNDRPVRLYGIVPIKVTDQETVLEPVIAAAEEWAPKETFDVRVSEAAGKPMTYTLAVVDEGLLGLTRFQTPDLHDAFFTKEALAVNTYDMYRHVLGSLNGGYGKTLAIGGGGEGDGVTDQTANRFEAVVRHLGPFQLPAGGSANHKVTLPNYVGAVRVMVVASNNRAFGSADERIPVVQPLMLLPTLPRVLGPGETLDMPVTVFTMDEKVRNVKLDVAESEGLVNATAPRQSMSFAKTGNQLTYFPLTVGDRTGVARFTVSGSGAGERTSQEIEIDVRHPNEMESRVEMVLVPAGETVTVPYKVFGLPGTQAANLELTTLPPLQLGRHLDQLLRYPYGCAEQTTSPAFAQVYLDKVMNLNFEQNKRRKRNVAAAIRRLRLFQTATGGIGYWPGHHNTHPWASSYVLHFLLEAERAGFIVPAAMKDNLVRFQAKMAGKWSDTDHEYYVSDEQRRRDQAYRLYGLALAGKADIGAMNRLRLKGKEMPQTAAYQLAAAYALLGQQQTAGELIADRDGVVTEYREFGYTFGSRVRDMAIVLEAQMALGNETAAGRQAFRLAEDVSKRRYLNTQEAAFVLVAIAKFANGTDTRVAATVTVPGGSAAALAGPKGIVQTDLPLTGGATGVRIQNTGNSVLNAAVIVSGKPRPGEEQLRNDNLQMRVEYLDPGGNPLAVDKLASGTDFLARYTISNPGALSRDYRQLALRTLVPSGWEISNDRLDVADNNNDGSYNYRDFRDDRVYTFFHLNNRQSKTFTFKMTATYPGRYYLPSQLAEAMYVDEVAASVKGRWVEVTR